MFDMFSARRKEYDKFKRGETTKDEYDNWCYNYLLIEAERAETTFDTHRKETT